MRVDCLISLILLAQVGPVNPGSQSQCSGVTPDSGTQMPPCSQTRPPVQSRSEHGSVASFAEFAQPASHAHRYDSTTTTKNIKTE